MLRALPKVKLEKEPQRLIRWLEPDEETRLLSACNQQASSPRLASIVTLALETGMRKGELLGLTWDRVDLSRGVIRLESQSQASAARSRCARRSMTSSPDAGAA